ncbi:MAG: cobalamin-binding protein [Gemmatimonadales bacterium]
MRIASLLASGTEIVCALGLGDRLVGISHECDYPPEVLDRPRLSAPRFDVTGLASGEIDLAVRRAAAGGGVYRLDSTLLATLAPDLIITQAVCEVCAVPTDLAEEAAAMLDTGVRTLSLDSHSMDDVLDSIRALGSAAGVPERAEALAMSLRNRIEAVRSSVEGLPCKRVLAIEWLDPPFVPGHWVPEMIESAGGECLAGDRHRPSRSVSWDELSGLDPDILLVMPCGYGLERSLEDAREHAEGLLQIGPRAISMGTAYVVDGSAYFNRSGPRMAEGVEILAALLHPDRSGRVDLQGKADRWCPT